MPVFIRFLRIPQRVILSVKLCTDGSAHRPPSTCRLPICIRPFRNVPAVITTERAKSSIPQIVRIPIAHPSFTISSSAWSWKMSRLSVLSSILFHSVMNFSLSHCALGLQTAGPFDRLSMRNCIAVASVTSPICPPKASISLTICPFAMPPTAGLQLIWAILFMSIVTKHTFAPMFAAAVAASQPA